MCFDFLYSFVWNTFVLKKTWSSFDQKMYIGLHVKCPLFLSDFYEAFTFSTVFLKKKRNIKFHENSFGGSRVVLCGQTDGRTDRHDEANSRFSQFFEGA